MLFKHLEKELLDYQVIKITEKEYQDVYELQKSNLDYFLLLLRREIAKVNGKSSRGAGYGVGGVEKRRVTSWGMGEKILVRFLIGT